MRLIHGPDVQIEHQCRMAPVATLSSWRTRYQADSIRQLVVTSRHQLISLLFLVLTFAKER
jgi:hypothetical protein